MKTFGFGLKIFSLFSVINLRHYWWYYFFVSIGIIFSVSILSFFQIMGQPSEIGNLINWAFWFFLNVGIINITGSGLSLYGNKNVRIHLLTLPVANSMRLFTMILYSIVIPAIIITLIYTITANTIALICTMNDFADPFTFNPFKQTNLVSHLLFFLTLQSLFLMIGSFFMKAGIMKTYVSVICILLVILLVDSITASYSVDKSIFWNMFNIITSDKNSSTDILIQMPSFYIVLKNTISIVLIPISYYIVLQRIKELEV